MTENNNYANNDWQDNYPILYDISSRILTLIKLGHGYVTNISPSYAKPILILNEFLLNVGTDTTVTGDGVLNANLKFASSMTGTTVCMFAGPGISSFCGLVASESMGKTLDSIDSKTNEFLTLLSDSRGLLLSTTNTLQVSLDDLQDLTSIKESFKQELGSARTEFDQAIDSFVEDFSGVVRSLNTVAEGGYSYIQVPGMATGMLLQKQGDEFVEIDYPTYEPEQYASQFEGMSIESESSKLEIDGEIYNIEEGSVQEELSSSIGGTVELGVDGEGYFELEVEGNKFSVVKEGIDAIAAGVSMKLDDLQEMINNTGKHLADYFDNTQLQTVIRSFVSNVNMEELSSKIAAGLILGRSAEEVAKEFAIQKFLAETPIEILATELVEYFDGEELATLQSQIRSNPDTVNLDDYEVDQVAFDAYMEDHPVVQAGYAAAIFLATTAVLDPLDGDGMDSEDWAKASGNFAANYAVELGLKEFGASKAMGTGIGAGMAHIISAGISDINAQDSMNSHQWQSTINTGAAIGALSFALSAALPGPGIVMAALATVIVSKVFGGKEYGAGEAPTPGMLLSQIRSIQEKEDGVNQSVYTIAKAGYMSIAREGYEDDLYGNDGSDVLVGNEEVNLLVGGDGDDTLLGRGGADKIVGGKGDDHIEGDYYRVEPGEASSQEETNNGTDGDEIVGGADFLNGGLGNDHIVGGAGNDYIIGGKSETIEETRQRLYDDAVTAIEEKYRLLEEQAVHQLTIAHSSYSNDGHVSISALGEQLIAEKKVELLLLKEEEIELIEITDSEAIAGRWIDGNDYILGQLGNDVIDGEEGNDYIAGGEGDDELYGNIGEDHLLSGSGDDYLDGGVDNDQLEAGSGDDVVIGGDGNDKVFGDIGNDRLDGGSGNDQLFGGEGNDMIDGGLGDDQLDGGTGNDFMSGGLGDDFIYGDTGNDYLLGEIGNDTLAGGKGSDILDGGSGNDLYIYAIGDGADQISDNSGNDIIRLIEIEDLGVDAEGNNLGVNYKAIDPTTVTLEKLQNDLLIKFINNTNDSITIKNHFNGNAIETLDFGLSKTIDLSSITVLENGSLNYEIKDPFAVNNTEYGLPTEYRDVVEETRAVDFTLDSNWYNNNYHTLTLEEKRKDNELFNEIEIREYKVERSGSFGGHYTVYYNYYNGRLEGNINNNRIVGNYWNEVITGEAGSDQLYGNGGVDNLYGGEGADLLVGGSNEDVLIGDYHGEGIRNVEFLSGGAGNDKINSGSGDDFVVGENGNDTMLGDGGNDTMFGGAGDDYIAGGLGNDAIDGDMGNDILLGNEGDDDIVGDIGDDILKGGLGNDNLSGNAGKDALFGNSGNDYLDGGDGGDFLDGGEGDNVIIGDAGDDLIYADSGNNVVNGGTGNNRIVLGDGNNQIASEDGNNQIAVGDGNNQVILGDGDNQLNIGDGNNQFEVGDGDNQFALGNGDNHIVAGYGNNHLTAGDGNNNIITTTGNDQLEVGHGNNQVHAGEGNNQITAGDGDNDLVAGDGNDIITVGDGNNQLEAGHGNNQIITGDGNNNITTGTGIDIITTGNGDNVVNSGSGNDQITTGSGNDQLLAGHGDDIIKGGAGNDTYIYYKTDGNDVIEDSSGNNVIEFKDLRAKDIDFSKDGDNLVITVRSTLSTITLLNHFASSQVAMNLIFKDGYNIDLSNIILGTDGDDNLIGTSGDDTIMSLNGNDTISGRAGDDYLNGGDGNDVIYGEEGNDRIDGSYKDDYLDGGVGDDVITDGLGSDRMYGGSGQDEFVVTANNDLSTIHNYIDEITDFNVTEDTLNLESFSNRFVNLDQLKKFYNISEVSGNTELDLGNGHKLILENISKASLENNVNIKFDLTQISGLIGSNENEIITGTSGNDIIIDGKGFDVLTGGTGNDMFTITQNSENGDIDTIVDFTQGTDIIDIRSFGDYIDVRHLDMAQKGNDTIIYFDQDRARDIGSQKLIIKNINKDNLTNNDFKFREFDGIGIHQRYTGQITYDFNKDGKTEGNQNIGEESYLSEGVSGYINGSNYETDNFDTVDNVFNQGYDIECYNHWMHYRINGTSYNTWEFIAPGRVYGTGTNLNDYIVGAVLDPYSVGSGEYVRGRGGHDLIEGKMDNDTLYGDEGNDYIDGGSEDDEIYGGVGNDKVLGGTGNDYIDGGENNDTLNGNSGDDIVKGKGGDDYVSGDEGNDTLYGNDGYDELKGGTGNDWLHGGNHDDRLDGGSGNDSLHGGHGNDTLQGGAGNDYVRGDAGNDRVEGGAGDDVLYGNIGDDEVKGNGGNDILYGNDEGRFGGEFDWHWYEGYTVSSGGWSSDDKYPREIADVNGDGFADIVGFGHSTIYVALGKGDGEFGTAKSVLNAFTVASGGWSSQNNYPRRLGDINGDGCADIVAFGSTTYIS